MYIYKTNFINVPTRWNFNVPPNMMVPSFTLHETWPFLSTLRVSEMFVHAPIEELKLRHVFDSKFPPHMRNPFWVWYDRPNKDGTSGSKHE